jgi:hypothetical protein
MADNNTKVEEVGLQIADLKAQLLDCSPKVKKNLTNGSLGK